MVGLSDENLQELASSEMSISFAEIVNHSVGPMLQDPGGERAFPLSCRAILNIQHYQTFHEERSECSQLFSPH